jgi:hypothetical protein
MSWLVAFLGEVPNLPTVVARVAHWRGLLWWPSYSQLLQSGRSAVVLLLLWLELLAAALNCGGLRGCPTGGT